MARRAFTLIELLVVIAIIAILAAIIFPVFAKAKEAAFRSGDQSNMNALRSALQLYRVDQGGYPPALLGYVTTYTPGGTDIVPADLLKGFLYPKRVDSFSVFKPALNRKKMTDTTTAFWPAPDQSAVGQRPIVDTNGDGKVNGQDDILGARQAYGAAADPPVCDEYKPCTNTQNQKLFYMVDGYDVSEKRPPAGRYELRYALFWTNFAIGNGNGFGQGSSSDDPRQLGYSEPPDTTPITWNAYFRDHDGQGKPVPARKDIVLFLGGGARPYASNMVSDMAWRIMP